jgi:membrane associated rhomboid family serine protease
MGFQDRDYYRSPRSTGNLSAHLRAWSVTTWLIAINCAVFVLDLLTNHLLYDWGYFSITAAIQFGQVWRFLTFQFLHANINHIFFNMLSLYFFGPMVESYLGSRRYLAFYLLSGIAGAVSYIILYNLHILISFPYLPLVGASAGIFGVLLAAVQIAPNARVMLMFPPIPMKLRTLAWVMIAIAAYTVIGNGRNAGGEAAHLGGAAVGAILIRFPKALSIFDFRLPKRRRRGPRDDWDPFRPNFRR